MIYAGIPSRRENMIFDLAATATETLILKQDACVKLAQQQINALRQVAKTAEQRNRVANLEQAMARRLNPKKINIRS